MTEFNVIIEHLKQINSSVESLSSRVQKLEIDNTSPQVDSQPTRTDTRSTEDDERLNQNGVEINNNNSQASVSPYSTTGASADVQREYDRLRDSLNRVPLPKNYKVNDSAKGIGKEGRQTLAIISKCARFSETGLKVLADLQPVSEDDNVVTLQKEDLQKFFTVFAAQTNFLQGEFANLVVKSTFDDETSRLFRSFENNSAAFSDRSLQNIRLAAELASHTSVNQRSRGQGQSRSNWRGHRGFSFRGGYNFHNRNVFPPRPPREEQE